MPGPARLVRRSILAAMRTGLSRKDAASLVLSVARACWIYLDVEQPWLAEWFMRVTDEAERQAGPLPSVGTTRKDTTDAPTSEAGRPATAQAGAEETGHDPQG